MANFPWVARSPVALEARPRAAHPTPHTGAAIRDHAVPLQLSLTLGGAAIAYGAVSQGGFFWPQAAVVAALLAGAAVFARPSRRGTRPAVLAFASLAAGLGASAAAAGWPQAARLPAAALAAAIAGFFLGRGLVAAGQRGALLD